MRSCLPRKRKHTARAALKHIRHLVPHYLASSVVLIDEPQDEARLLVLDSDLDLQEAQFQPALYPG